MRRLALGWLAVQDDQVRASEAPAQVEQVDHGCVSAMPAASRTPRPEAWCSGHQALEPRDASLPAQRPSLSGAKASLELGQAHGQVDSLMAGRLPVRASSTSAAMTARKSSTVGVEQRHAQACHPAGERVSVSAGVAGGEATARVSSPNGLDGSLIGSPPGRGRRYAGWRRAARRSGPARRYAGPQERCPRGPTRQARRQAPPPPRAGVVPYHLGRAAAWVRSRARPGRAFDSRREGLRGEPARGLR